MTDPAVSRNHVKKSLRLSKNLNSDGITVSSADPVASSDDVFVSDEPPRTRPQYEPRKEYQVDPERVASLKDSTRSLLQRPPV